MFVNPFSDRNLVPIILSTVTDLFSQLVYLFSVMDSIHSGRLFCVTLFLPCHCHCHSASWAPGAQCSHPPSLPLFLRMWCIAIGKGRDRWRKSKGQDVISRKGGVLFPVLYSWVHVVGAWRLSDDPLEGRFLSAESPACSMFCLWQPVSPAFLTDFFWYPLGPIESLLPIWSPRPAVSTSPGNLLDPQAFGPWPSLADLESLGEEFQSSAC